jgi:hypothetical protein
MALNKRESGALCKRGRGHAGHARPKIVLRKTVLNMKRFAVLLAVVLWLSSFVASGVAAETIVDPDDGTLPAFSPGDLPARRAAACEELRTMADALAARQMNADADARVDLTLAGPLTAVRSDGVLWYLVMCRDLRVMCVTYQSNGMQAGSSVTMRGAWRRVDENHALLDPCLASAD